MVSSVENLIRETLERIRERIAENIESKGLTASGKTARSMEVHMHDSGGWLEGRQYFQSLELGRPGGRVPYNFNGIIRQWIIDKGLIVPLVPYKRQPSERWQPKYSVEERSLRIMAGSIAHSIEQRGTKLYRDGGRADIYSDVIEEEVADLRTVITNAVVESIKQQL